MFIIGFTSGILYTSEVPISPATFPLEIENSKENCFDLTPLVASAFGTYRDSTYHMYNFCCNYILELGWEKRNVHLIKFPNGGILSEKASKS